MPYTFQFKRDTAERWATQNTILENGEPGYEKDTGKLKIGDGATRWADLDYFVGGVLIPTDTPITNEEILAHIASATPHPVYDDGPSFLYVYQNAKV